MEQTPQEMLTVLEARADDPAETDFLGTVEMPHGIHTAVVKAAAEDWVVSFMADMPSHRYQVYSCDLDADDVYRVDIVR